MTRLLMFCVGLGACCGPLLAQVCSQCPPRRPASAKAAWTLLTGGYDGRFNKDCNVNGNCESARFRGSCRRGCTATAQSPFAVVLSCADSRVPPELVFDQGIGDLFIIRIAGNIASTEAKGSIEYALTKFNPRPKLLLVLGHEDCGAARAAVEYQPPKVWPGSPEVFSIVAPIFRAVGDCKDYSGNTCISGVVTRNVQRVLADLNAFKAVQDAKQFDSTFGVGGMVYDLKPKSSLIVVQDPK